MVAPAVFIRSRESPRHGQTRHERPPEILGAMNLQHEKCCRDRDCASCPRPPISTSPANPSIHEHIPSAPHQSHRGDWPGHDSPRLTDRNRSPAPEPIRRDLRPGRFLLSTPHSHLRRGSTRHVRRLCSRKSFRPSEVPTNPTEHRRNGTEHASASACFSRDAKRIVWFDIRSIHAVLCAPPSPKCGSRKTCRRSGPSFLEEKRTRCKSTSRPRIAQNFLFNSVLIALVGQAICRHAIGQKFDVVVRVICFVGEEIAPVRHQEARRSHRRVVDFGVINFVDDPAAESKPDSAGRLRRRPDTALRA